MPITEFEAWGVKMKSSAATVIVILVILIGAWWLKPSDGQKEVVNQKAINAALQEQFKETAKHIGEDLQKPWTLYESMQGKIVVGIYRDRCIAHVAIDPEGAIVASNITTDILKDADRRSALDLVPLLHASGMEDSRCNYVNHGPMAREPVAEQRQGNNVLMHVWMKDG